MEDTQPAPGPGLALVFTVGSMLSTMSWWLDHGKDLSPQEMGRLLDRLVMRPIHAPQDAA